DSEEGEVIDVPQNLAPEQYQYEFPSRSRLEEVSRYDAIDDCFSYLDESSFTTTSTSTAACSTLLHEFDTEDENNHSDKLLIDDGRLSPLQLPAQFTHNAPYSPTGNEGRTREQSYDSTMTVTQVHSDQKQESPVGPFSFLSDSRSDTTSSSKVVIIKINKSNPAFQRPSSLTFLSSDEGYYEDDEDYKELPIESASVFLPLSEEEQSQLLDHNSVRTSAAIHIQSVWRGYQTRKALKNMTGIQPTHRLMVNIMRICGTVHRQQMKKIEQRLYNAEQCLREETSIRIAFEKAMEDMTVLVDQQQKGLHERLEQEVSVREAYESKFEQTFAQIQPLESRLKKETQARCELESMMQIVIDQVHDMKITRQRQEKEEAESKRALQRQLDEAMEQIALLKKNKTIVSKPTTTTLTSTPHTSHLRTQTSSAVSRPTTPLRTPKSTAASRPTTPLRTKPSQTLTRSRPANPRSTLTETPLRRTRVPTEKTTLISTKSTAPVARKPLISRK
ncbi:hypothetical protein BDF14DRAFT_1720991, partial [Spinellus fusiger]